MSLKKNWFNKLLWFENNPQNPPENVMMSPNAKTFFPDAFESNNNIIWTQIDETMTCMPPGGVVARRGMEHDTSIPAKEFKKANVSPRTEILNYRWSDTNSTVWGFGLVISNNRDSPPQRLGKFVIWTKIPKRPKKMTPKRKTNTRNTDTQNEERGKNEAMCHTFPQTYSTIFDSNPEPSFGNKVVNSGGSGWESCDLEILDLLLLEQ